MAHGSALLILLLLLPLPACSHPQETRGSEVMLKLPYEPAAKDCYSRLKKCNKAFQNGFEEMRNQAGGSSPFPERLNKVFSVFERAAAEGNAQPSSQTWSEQDVYLCCAFDLTKAMFDSEMKAIQAEQLAADKKREKLESLVKLLEGLPIGGPKWNQIIMPGIKTKLEDAARSLGK